MMNVQRRSAASVLILLMPIPLGLACGWRRWAFRPSRSGTGAVLWAAAMDAFRVSLAGRILLGCYFSLKNIAAYWLAITLVALVDEILLRRVMAKRCASRL